MDSVQKNPANDKVNSQFGLHGGDTVFLRDSAGNIVLQETYTAN